MNWTEGPTIESQEASGMKLMGSPVDDYVLAHGVLVTRGTPRAVLLAVAKTKRQNPAEALFAGSSLQEVIEDGEGTESLRREYAQTIRENFTSSIENFETIDPKTDLEGFS